MKPNCSIIVRTLNEERYLVQLLDGIGRQSYPRGLTEVIVVDSGSTDQTLEIAKAHGCRIVTLRREEFSFGRSLNLGCAAALGQILVFVSGHCVPVDENWLWALVQPLHESRVAIAYGRQVGGPETKFSEHAIFAKYFPATVQNDQSPFFCNNANLALRRSCWEEIQFDEMLTGLEDLHLAKQLNLRNWKITYVPDAQVLHYHHERWPQVMRRYEREAIALRAIMPEVQLHWYDGSRYFLAGVLADWSRALQQGILHQKALESVVFRFCQFYGAWRGNTAHRHLSRQQKERYFYPN